MTYVDASDVASMLRDLGVQAYVEHTGGGCFTLMAGDSWTGPDGGGRMEAVVGPLGYEGPGTGEYVYSLHAEEAYVSREDDGLTPYVDLGVLKPFTAEAVTAAILAWLEADRKADDHPIHGTASWQCDHCGAEIVALRTVTNDPALSVLPCQACGQGVDLDHARKQA